MLSAIRLANTREGGLSVCLSVRDEAQKGLKKGFSARTATHHQMIGLSSFASSSSTCSVNRQNVAKPDCRTLWTDHVARNISYHGIVPNLMNSSFPDRNGGVSSIKNRRLEDRCGTGSRFPTKKEGINNNIHKQVRLWTSRSLHPPHRHRMIVAGNTHTLSRKPSTRSDADV